MWIFTCRCGSIQRTVPQLWVKKKKKNVSRNLTFSKSWCLRGESLSILQWQRSSNTYKTTWQKYVRSLSIYQNTAGWCSVTLMSLHEAMEGEIKSLICNMIYPLPVRLNTTLNKTNAAKCNKCNHNPQMSQANQLQFTKIEENVKHHIRRMDENICHR